MRTLLDMGNRFTTETLLSVTLLTMRSGFTTETWLGVDAWPFLGSGRPCLRPRSRSCGMLSFFCQAKPRNKNKQ